MTHSRSILLASLLAIVGWSSFASADTVSYWEFLESRTAAEQKLPLDVVIERRSQLGESVPDVAQSRSSRSSAGPEAPKIYKLEGVSATALVDALADMGLAPHFVSATQPYVTAYLLRAQLVQLAESAALRRATPVSGPRAQGQTEPAVSHRVNDDIIQIDTGLTGDGVVIGLISQPFKADFVTEIRGADATLIPASDALHVLEGASIAPCVPTDPPADPPCLYEDATNDALNLLQVIHDIAPGAEVVMASPGLDSVPEQMAQVVELLAAGQEADAEAGTDAVPAAHIIIDDLFYPDQNPFALDQLSAAITAASEGGAVYITAAGDGGRGNDPDSTSDTHTGPFNFIEAPAAVVAINPTLFSGKDVHDFGGQGYLVAQEALDQVCFYWNERPADEGATAFFIAFIYSSANAYVDSIFVPAPGGCSTAPIPADAKIIVYSPSGGDFRFMLSGERSTTPASLAYTDSVFDLPSAGTIRGHAALAEAITVAGAKLCADNFTTPYADCPELDIGAYSADGDNINPRFYWQLDGDDYSEIAEPAVSPSARKPNVTAAGLVQIQEWEDPSLTQVSYVGTSVSAAVAAGIGALYWEYRAPVMTGIALAREVEAALRDATTDGLGFVDANFGWGVLDAPKAFDPDGDPVTDEIADGDTLFDEPLPAENVAVTGTVGGVSLSFDKSLDDISEAFRYEVSCNDAGNFAATLFPADSGSGLVGDNKAPVLLAAGPGETVVCDVKPRKDDSSAVFPPSEITASGTGGEVTPVAVTMTAKAAGAILEFDPSPLDGEPGVGYEVSCTENNSAISGWNPKTDAQPDTPYVFQANANRTIECGVAVVVTVEGTEYASTETTASAVTTSIPGPTVSIQADQGGVSVGWSIANIADTSMATATLRCTDVATGNVVINDEPLSYGGGFVEAAPGVALSCEVSTTVRVNGFVRSTNTSASVTVTPEEELGGGLPIYLLYIASLPQSAVDQSVGTSVGDLDSFTWIHSGQSAGQTFTAGLSGELTSVTIFLKNGGAATEDLSVAISAVSGGLPSGAALATQSIANADVPATEGAVTVTFETPATVAAGTEYAILVSSPASASGDEHFEMFYIIAEDYVDGAALEDDGTGANWAAQGYDFSFETVVTAQ